MRFFSREEIRDGVYNLYREIEKDAARIPAAKRLIAAAEKVYDEHFKTVAGRDIIGRLLQWGFEMNGVSYRDYVSEDDLKCGDFAYTVYVFAEIGANVDQCRALLSQK